MKHRNMKFILLTALFLIISALPVDMQAQLKEPFAQPQEFEAPLSAPPSGMSGPRYAPPPGGGNGDANREELPASNGFWIMVGLALSYGIVCRRKRKTDTD